ncbi:MAG: pro-sigmaK processing inhibitor BofA family protein [Clostridia bacterium]|nr:pro-sigmaK processing inhibitor BofA family protein [Clostridia bacterium]
MEILKYAVISVLSLSAFLIFCFAVKSGKLLKTLLLNGFIGICLLAIINLTSRFSGVHIPINLYTVSSSAVLGIPALIGFLLLVFIF